MGRLVQPSQGVETREVASRRGELGFYKAQQLKQYDRQDAQTSTPLGARTKKVSFSTPEVTSAISPEYFDADSPTDKPLPKVVAKAPTSGLKQKFAFLSNLLFSPRQTPLFAILLLQVRSSGITSRDRFSLQSPAALIRLKPTKSSGLQISRWPRNNFFLSKPFTTKFTTTFLFGMKCLFIWCIAHITRSCDMPNTLYGRHITLIYQRLKFQPFVLCEIRICLRCYAELMMLC